MGQFPRGTYRIQFPAGRVPYMQGECVREEPYASEESAGPYI
jgi:hypothetical protein